LTRPTKRGVWQVVTVILLAAATAGVVAINDMTQSPRSVAPATAAKPSPQLVGEEGAAAPSWLMKTAVSALSAKRDTTPSSAYWGYASASEDPWGILKAADPDESFYWLVFKGDFHSFTASGNAASNGRWLVLAVDAADRSVAASALSAQTKVDPAIVSWLHPLALTVGEE